MARIAIVLQGNLPEICGEVLKKGMTIMYMNADCGERVPSAIPTNFSE